VTGDTETVEMQQVMEDVVDISSQVDALASEEDTSDTSTDEQPGEDAEADAGVLADSATNNQFVQVIQPEDIGDAADPDAAPAVTPNCACN